jgi:hypothetical protein
MTPVLAQPTPAHHAALTLHAMSAADRGWLLGRLEPAQRRTVQPLLAELNHLRIPQEAGLLQDVLAPQHGAAATSGIEKLADLDDHAVAWLAQALAAEPPAVAAALLSVRDWRWSARLLASFTRARAAEVRHASKVAGAAPELASAVLAEVSARCADAPRSRPPIGLWRRLAASMPAWSGKS